MKKINFVIIGFLVGAVCSVLMINGNKNLVYGESESDFAEGMYNVSMSDIFSAASNPGKNLYNFVRSSNAYKPAQKALDILAESYSFTRDQANAVLSGSPTPFMSGGNGPSFSLADATKMTTKFIEDFEMLRDIYDLQQEIEIEVGASEIFSNGDLEDSGFDLIIDLSNIEVVLFGAESSSSMGSDFDNEMNEPFTINLIEEITPNDSDDDDDSKITFNDDGTAKLEIGGEEKDVNTLEEDVCPEDNVYKDAVDQNEIDNPDDKEDPDSPIPNDKGGAGANPVSDSGIPSEIPEVEPEDFDKVFCIGIDEPEQKKGADAVPSGQVSSSGTGSWLQVGEGGNAEDAIFTLNASICFDIEFIYEKYSSKNVGDSCVLCYIKKINEQLDKVVSGSLLPSKTTGSLFESGKCKETGAGIAIAVVGVPVPVPTPVNDDIVFGKNIFEEWNKFADSVKGGWPKMDLPEFELSPDNPSVPPSPADTASKSCEDMSNQLDLFNCINNSLNKATAEAENNVEVYNQQNELDNALLFTQKLELELKQMKSFFDTFKETYSNDKSGTDSVIEVLDELNKKEVKS